MSTAVEVAKVKVPKKLYHCAPECVTPNISEEGLRSHFGEIYASDSQAGALTFMWFRLLDHFHHDREKNTAEVVAHNSVYVWEIDTSKTDKKKWAEGNDHNPAFFGDTPSWVYFGKSIPTSAILGCYVFTREVIEEAVNKSKSESEGK